MITASAKPGFVAPTLPYAPLAVAPAPLAYAPAPLAYAPAPLALPVPAPLAFAAAPYAIAAPYAAPDAIIKGPSGVIKASLLGKY